MGTGKLRLCPGATFNPHATRGLPGSAGGFPCVDVQESGNPDASNSSKADQDPSTWQPPAQGYLCPP
ncbi:hypothetical protein SAV14893_088340 [Streptomyces avermitilis]|uniref:Uncharacterized protein n=1 Tax=Streptomyces avermitilis TaxID=33903 RepID=A0A4D4N832_STRAX|nr:hypothetical protein SAVMC3_08230 [Streptomyces avermitilis]GDY69441.1 hypothetical protein SAV14893_088340 [Streptomyces avermitilis]GDY79689.1 hypothetical protein SAV31267_091740 [Streptomyces avermitilis]